MALNPTLPKALMPIRPEQAHHRQQARRAREALLAWINDSGCNWCLTLNPNRELPLGTEVGIVRAAFDDTEGWSRYITKEIYRPDFEFWSSSMWWPERWEASDASRTNHPGSAPKAPRIRPELTHTRRMADRWGR